MMIEQMLLHLPHKGLKSSLRILTSQHHPHSSDKKT